MDLDVGDRVTMVGNSKHEQTRQRTMTVVGIYDVGVPSVEKETIYVSLSEAQQLFGLTGQVTEVVISVEQIGQEPPVMNAINESVPGYEVESWETSIPDLKRGMEMEASAMKMFGVIILSIAAVGILNLLMMAVFERTREIGVISAMGLKPREITFIFLLEGILIGVIAAVFGAGLGTAANVALGYYGLDYSAFTEMTEYTALISGRIYSQLVPMKVLNNALIVAVISALASIYPAREASRREPAEALHYV